MPVSVPSPGDEVYVPSAWYISRGRDDVCGGRATVERVEERYSTTWIYVREVPGRGYNWEILGPEQERLRQEYAGQVAQRCPDDDPSANTGDL